MQDTKILVRTPNVIRNGYFDDPSFTWLQYDGQNGDAPGTTTYWATTQNTWFVYSGYAKYLVGSGNSNIQQNDVLKVGKVYRVKIKVSDIGVGENLRIRMTYNSLVTQPEDGVYIIAANGSYVVDMTAYEKNFIIESSSFTGSISQIEVREYPGEYSLDLNAKQSVALTFNIDDIRYPEKRKTTWSKTITIPGTKQNNKLFGQIFEIDGDGTFNPNKKTEATILQNGVIIFDGVLQLLSVNRSLSNDSHNAITYSVTLIGAAGSIYQTWGDQYLDVLDFSMYDHFYNITNVKNSWLGHIKKTQDSGSLVVGRNYTIQTLNADSFTNVGASANAVGVKFTASGTTPAIWTGGSKLSYDYDNYTLSGPGSYAISALSVDGTAPNQRVKMTFTGVHSLVAGDYVLVDTNNYILSGEHVVYSVPNSTSVVLGTAWAELSDYSTPTTGVVRKRSLLGEGYVYPMIDSVGKTDYDANLWKVKDFYPAVFLREILVKAFQLAGYSWESTILDSQWFRRLIVPFALENLKLSEDLINSLLFRVGTTSNADIAKTYHLFPFDTTGGSPLVNIGSVGSTFPYNAPYNYYYNPTHLAEDTFASHHRVGFTGQEGATNNGQQIYSFIVPFNDSSTGSNFDNSSAFSVSSGSTYPGSRSDKYPDAGTESTYVWSAPVQAYPVRYTFTFTGTFTHSVENPTAWNGFTGDFPSDYSAGLAYTAYPATAFSNGLVQGATPFDGSWTGLPNAGVATSYYDSYDQRVVFEYLHETPGNLGGSLTNNKWLEFSQDNGYHLPSGGVFSTNGRTVWNGTNITITGDITVPYMPSGIGPTARTRVRVRVYSRSKITALNSSYRPCVGSTANGYRDVTVTTRIKHPVFYNSIQNDNNIEGLLLEMEQALPKVKIKDLFTSVCKMFNLVIDQDKNNSKLLYIEPRNDFYIPSYPLDWTSKLNLASPMDIKPLSEISTKEYVWKFKEDKDYYNTDYKLDWGTTDGLNYGDTKLVIDNDFVNGVTTNESIFSATVLVGPSPLTSGYGSTGRVISATYGASVDNLDPKRITTNVRLLFYALRGTNVPFTISQHDSISGSNVRILIPEFGNVYSQAAMLSLPGTGVGNPITGAQCVYRVDEDKYYYSISNNPTLLAGWSQVLDPWFNFAGVLTTDWYLYPYAGHLDTPNGPTRDINYYFPKALYYDQRLIGFNYTDNNLYNAFHRQYMEEITSPVSKMVTAEIRLQAKDIANLDFRRLINISGHVYRLMKISDYNTGGDGLTKCTFIKVENGTAFVPRQYFPTGGNNPINAGGGNQASYGDS